MTSTKTKAGPKHKEGSRKSKVHALFDKEGQDAAWTLGLKLKLAQSTLRAWFATWRREAQPMKKRLAAKTSTPKPAKISKPTKLPAPPAPEPVESIPAFLQG